MSETPQDGDERIATVVASQVEAWEADYKMVLAGFAKGTNMEPDEAVAALTLMQTWSLMTYVRRDYDDRREWYERSKGLVNGQEELIKRALEEMDGGEGWKP